MKQNNTYSIVLLSLLLLSCSSSELVENWKHPDIETFEAQKVLVLGMTADIENRKAFERKLTSELKKNGVNAIKSLEFFEKTFTATPKTEENLLTIEGQLLDAGFDAILLSKVTSIEDKVTVVQAYRNLDKDFRSFRDDYYANQHVYQDEDYYEPYEIYHAQTTLYCICPDTDRELIWKGSIDIKEPENIKKAIGDYVKLVIWALKGQGLLIIENDLEYEDIDI